MPATYEPIATTTLGSAAANITFSAIGSGYTDLRIVLVGRVSAADVRILNFNNDTVTNYSNTNLYGDGATAGSYRLSTQSKIFTSYDVVDAANVSLQIFDIFSYAGSTNKTVLCQTGNDRNGSGQVDRTVGLWRNTAAITSVKIANRDGSNFTTGTTATLYGILKA